MISEEDNKKELRCSRCGSKEVILVRKYSGEALCRNCLRNSLLSRMRRSVSKYGLLTRRDRLLYIRTGLPYDSVLWELFQEMESEFPVTVESTYVDVETSEGLWNSLYETVEESHKGKKLVIPLVLDDVVALFLKFIFQGSPSIFIAKGRVFLAMREIDRTIIPFVGIPIEEAWALLTNKIDNVEDILDYISKNRYLSMILKLEEAIPGARFNFLRSLERIDLLKSIGIVFR